MLALLLLSILPRDATARDASDLVEINHVYDEYGRLVFTQQIWWDWSENESRFNVRAWRMIKTPDQLPQRDHARGGYVTRWDDGGRIREVRTKSFRETWTQWDVELLNREVLPKEQRKELSK